LLALLKKSSHCCRTAHNCKSGKVCTTTCDAYFKPLKSTSTTMETTDLQGVRCLTRACCAFWCYLQGCKSGNRSARACAVLVQVGGEEGALTALYCLPDLPQQLPKCLHVH
jgi:hypothetical protein